MSVYIKGMEMPKTWRDCVFSNGAAQCKLDNMELCGLCYRERCPLIPVPDHGDLIERDSLPWYLKDVTEILEAPTIIPADCKEERTVKWREWNTFAPADKEDGE